MAVALDTENELLSSLSKKRTEFRNSFKLKPLNQTEQYPNDDINSVTTTSLTFTETTNDLMSNLRERRLKRRTLLSSISNTQIEDDTTAFTDDNTVLKEDNDDDTASLSVSQGMRKLKALRNRVRETRFDSNPLPTQHQQRPLPSRSATVPSSSTVPQKSSVRWKILSAQLGVAKDKTIEQRSFDFFTGWIDDDDDDQDMIVDQREETHTATQPADDNNEEMVDSAGDDGTAEIEERQSVLQDETGDRSTLFDQQVKSDGLISKGYSLCEYSLPKYIPYQLKVSKEQQLYFIPETVPVPPEHKTPGNAPPVYAEESGMYVGHRPKVNPSNQAIMENRLLKQSDEGAGWFGRDGLLKVLPDPIAPLVTRPLIFGYEENRQLVYKEIPTVEVNNQYLIQSKQNNDHYQMQFHIGQIQFNHHPLFSAEHVLAADLIEVSQKHETVDRHQIIKHLRQKFHAMEYTAYDIKQSLTKMDDGALENAADVVNSQLINYQKEMSEIWQQLKQFQSTEYQLVKSIVETWRNIKRQRDEQGYSCTNVQVTIQRITPDVSEDENQWERDVQFELNEQRMEFDTANRQRVLVYKTQLSQWKQYEKKRRRAQQQQDRRDGYTSSLAESSIVSGATEIASSEQQADTISMISIPPEKPRPVAPPVFNEEERRTVVVENYRKHFRKPGEPVLIPQLTFNHPITQQCPREEQLRRNEISATQYRIRILYNNKEICATKDSGLSNDFSVKFNELLKAEVVERPQAIAFQVINCSSLLSSVMAVVFVLIPDSSVTSSSTSADNYSFSVNHKVEYTHNGVGSGQCSPLLPHRGVLTTGGTVTAGVCWGETQDGRSLSPFGINRSSTAGGIIGNTNDIHKIKKWIEESRLDPNDPRNFELFDLLKTVPSAADNATYFRLQSIDDLERFVSDKEFKENKRFNLLQLREHGHPALKGKSIPLDEESVTESFWKTVQDYKPYGLSELPVTIFGNFYDEHNKERERYLIEIREKVLTRTGKRSHASLTLEDVIHEELIPNIGSLKNSLMEFFSPHQPLKPKRKPCHKPKPQNVHVDECHISVRIVHVMNVPLRGTSRSLTQETVTGQTKQPDEDTVRPFIEVSFGNERQRTLTSKGPHPHWNEEIILSFHPPQNNFSPVVLQKVTEELRFDLYDETRIDLLQDERDRETDLHHRIENKWLGVLAIPFATLHARTRIEGTFQMDTPPFVIGYHNNTTDGIEGAYIQLFVSLEPALGILPPITEKFDSAEDSQLLEKGAVWLKTLRERFPSRNYQTTVLDVSGKNVFLTRFVWSQNPPTELLPTDYKTLSGKDLLLCMEKLAWFVSLIPSLPDAILFSGTCDIWTTTNQFLHMLGGDEEEHAVLLCNYFLYIGQKAWIILGHAIPEGPTAYVLTYNPLNVNSYTLWNPTTGSHFDTTQSYLPLISIGTVFNNVNIWGNCQVWEHPGQVNFDFNNTKNWIPLFSSTMKSLPSIQVDTLNYSQTELDHVQLLQSRIDQIIHSHFENLRVRHLTRWNRYCSRKLQDILPKFEETLFASSDLQSQHYRDLTETFPAYDIHGYPLNLRCSNTRQLIDAIEHTGFHHCEQDKVEFGLGVYVHCYPNNVISIWVYLMTLVPNN